MEQPDGGGTPLTTKTFSSMGTVVSLSFPAADPLLQDAALAAAGEVFHAMDERFSLYKPASELSRLNEGALRLAEASPQLRAAYELAADWRLRTDGAFTPDRPDGALDLSGIVKALAMQDAGDAVRSSGLADWCLNAGGDVLCAGRPVEGADWTVGIVDPADRSALVTAAPLDPAAGRAAVATSGIAERGEHIWAAGAGAGARTFAQVSVVAADIVTADVLATAVVAGGQAMLDKAVSGWDVEIFAVDRSGQLLATPLFRAPASG